MNYAEEFALRALLIGGGATIVMDIWALVQKHVFGISPLNYGWLGRWLGHFRKGRVVHHSIGQAEPVRGERVLGWAAHYAIGVSFAALLLLGWGLAWARRPTLVPALIVGIGTVVAPLFIMQPAMGFGVAASKTAKPKIARFRSVLTHTIYGVGLYVSALVWAFLIRQ